MNVFELRNNLIRDYATYIKSFVSIRDPRVEATVTEELEAGLLWPNPLIQLNPCFKPGATIDELVSTGFLHDECSRIFRRKFEDGSSRPLRLHTHQEIAVRRGVEGKNYVLTTGTGSGKSLTYIIPIVDYVLKAGSGKGIKAIVVYPMNALANSQVNELKKFICAGYPEGQQPVTFDRYTGQEDRERRTEIISHPPDILLTNYVMLELLMTRPEERALIDSAKGLQFIVLDELHTYRGRQGSDVSMLLRRVRNYLGATNLQSVGTSATLATGGCFADQQKEVANVASTLFGSQVLVENIIGETLTPIAVGTDFSSTAVRQQMRESILTGGLPDAITFEDLSRHPLSAWLEGFFGVERFEGRLVRVTPKSIEANKSSGSEGAASVLANMLSLSPDECARAIERSLIAGYHCLNPETGFPAFAFRVHQFISRGDTVYASIEDPRKRVLTLNGQKFVPGTDKTKRLYPLLFCRECGEAYYSVLRRKNEQTGKTEFIDTPPYDPPEEQAGDPGYLYLSVDRPWPETEAEMLPLLPDDWLEIYKDQQRIKPSRRQDLPLRVTLGPNGQIDNNGVIAHFVSRPFRFCLHCGAAYNARQKSDFSKLATLGTEGRSTATTILSLYVVRALEDSTLPKEARKLLSFTDNRQDASLQAGHFNDFVEVGLMRSAIYRAVLEAGPDGLQHDVLAQKIFGTLALPFDHYAQNPEEQFSQRRNTEQAMRDVLGYRLYRDLRRGWRITMPNLEQCGLLRIEYADLPEICAAETKWQSRHPALAAAAPDVRMRVMKTLLDYMRRELNISVSYLESNELERINNNSWQRLKKPWGFDESERLESSGLLYPRSKREGDYQGDTYLSARGGFGLFLKRTSTFPDFGVNLRTDDLDAIIADLLETALCGLVKKVRDATENEVAAYQLDASCLLWKSGDGTEGLHDPIRMPDQAEDGTRVNPFFVNFYRDVAARIGEIRAHEHTAQVPSDVRQERENSFRAGTLPILYCSPTMELGIDIAELNVVHMRNIPPTPANYAQRSGRAGRNGQPALVLAYCSTGNSHDQYFFKRPTKMVAGAVSPPRLDLANEELIRAHVHAIWLTEAKLSLGSSLVKVIDANQPTLSLFENVTQTLRDFPTRQKARQRAEAVLRSIQSDLEESDWFSEGWIDEVVSKVESSFEQACERWRTLYRAAQKQADSQNKVIRDATSSEMDRNRAERLRAEAEQQIKLLTTASSAIQSDFYSYRYFASEGFLPGYNFPRLPLSAYIPGRKREQKQDEYLSRSRFLAISEFGPRAFVYHEGSKYVINKVIIPVSEQGDGAVTSSIRQCAACGFIHRMRTREQGDVTCNFCHAELPSAISGLFWMQNVVAKRREKINSDEEERMRLGYDLRTGLRYQDRDGALCCRYAEVVNGTASLAKLTYGHATSLWRINFGWKKRGEDAPDGFVLDLERGYWETIKAFEDQDEADQMSRKLQRVIPYVEDRRNSLMFEPAMQMTDRQMATLQAALKQAIQIEYQLEDNELVAEPLPSRATRSRILLYESAEGGAGVLRHLASRPQALAGVAREALKLCHFNPDTGADLSGASGISESCEAACYNCLMSYSNQMDHELLDRACIRDFLLGLAGSTLHQSASSKPRAEHLRNLMDCCESELERKFLRFLEDNGLNLPTHGQHNAEEVMTRLDFCYLSHEMKVAIYVDGPPHDTPQQKEKDRDLDEKLADSKWGYPIRFHHQADWRSIAKKHPDVFGSIQSGDASKKVKLGVVTAKFVKDDNEAFSEKDKSVCRDEILSLLQKALNEKGSDAQISFNVEYLDECESSFLVEFIVSAFSNIRDFGETAASLAVAFGIFGGVIKWYGKNIGIKPIEKFGIRMQWVTARLIAGGGDDKKPGCYGQADYLDKRMSRCRDCDFLKECQSLARPGGST